MIDGVMLQYSGNRTSGLTVHIHYINQIAGLKRFRPVLNATVFFGMHTVYVPTRLCT